MSSYSLTFNAVIMQSNDVLRDDLIALCVKHNLIGCAATFRAVGETVTLWLEAPGYRDGFCKDLAHNIAAILEESGAKTISDTEGICNPPKGKQ